MAFKSVSGKDQYKKLTELAVGESMVGYFLGKKDSTTIEGATNLIMVIENDRFLVSAAGNVKYLLMDGKLTPGQLTRITRQEDVKIKGKRATSFAVEQDADDTIAVDTSLQVGTPPQNSKPISSVADKIAAMKGG